MVKLEGKLKEGVKMRQVQDVIAPYSYQRQPDRIEGDRRGEAVSPNGKGKE